jgi:hypothetical protein
MIMVLNTPVISPGPWAALQYLHKTFRCEALKVPINRAQAYVRQIAPHQFINMPRVRMSLELAKLIEDEPALYRYPLCFILQLRPLIASMKMITVII